MSIASNLNRVIQELNGSGCRLIAVSKTKSAAEIMEAYDTGVRNFGENRVQELKQKYQRLPKDIEWHMIGHLQTNKVKLIVPFVTMIHGVDSLRLAQEIDRQAARVNRTIPCLLQVHIAREESKYGFEDTQLIEMIGSGAFDQLSNVRFCGLMGMATFTSDLEQVRLEFRKLKSLFDEIKKLNKHGNFDFKEISMGMSDDYQIAIQEGSTMVRVGSSIFGSRN